MINPLMLYGIAGSLMIGAIAGWTVRDWKSDADALRATEKAEKIRADLQKKVDDTAISYEEWKQVANVNTVETRNTVREIYRNVEVPSDCAVTPDAARLLQKRVDSAVSSATGKPSSEL